MIKNNVTISRIFNAEYLIDNIKNNTITFSHPSSFKDIWELQIEHLYFIQCWGINQGYESWQIYDKNKTGLKVVIHNESFEINNWLSRFNNTRDSKSTFSNCVDINFFAPYKCYFIPVDYSKDDEYIEKLHDEISNLNPNHDNKDKIIDFLKYKKPIYSYEKEVRLILDLDTKRTNLKLELKTNWNPHINRNIRLISIPFNWATIIDYIEINPFASKEYADYIKEKLILSGISEYKIRYAKANKNPSVDFCLFLESYSSGNFRYIENIMLSFYDDFVKNQCYTQAHPQHYKQILESLPESTVFNMVFNYLDSILKGTTQAKQRSLENEALMPTKEKLLLSNDIKNHILLLFLAIHTDKVDDFLVLYEKLSTDANANKLDDMKKKKHNFNFFLKCKDKKYLKDELLKIWQDIWTYRQYDELSKFLDEIYQYYLESYKQYQEYKDLNKGNPFFAY